MGQVLAPPHSLSPPRSMRHSDTRRRSLRSAVLSSAHICSAADLQVLDQQASSCSTSSPLCSSQGSVNPSSHVNAAAERDLGLCAPFPCQSAGQPGTAATCRGGSRKEHPITGGRSRGCSHSWPRFADLDVGWTNCRAHWRISGRYPHGSLSKSA